MNRALSFLSRSEAETVRLGSAVARQATDSAVVALVGDLGTGKTRMVEGAAREMGYRGRVRSPTFTLLNIYRGRRPIRHFDLFRLDSPEGWELEEWMELWEERGLTLVEWADRLGVPWRSAVFPPGTLLIHLAHRGGDARRIALESPEGAWEGLFRSLEEGI